MCNCTFGKIFFEQLQIKAALENRLLLTPLALTKQIELILFLCVFVFVCFFLLLGAKVGFSINIGVCVCVCVYIHNRLWRLWQKIMKQKKPFQH